MPLMGSAEAVAAVLGAAFGGSGAGLECVDVFGVCSSDAVARFLITNGIGTGHVDREGHTALHFACAAGRFDVAKRLIEGGADLSRADSAGFTSVDEASAAVSRLRSVASRQAK